MPAPPVEALVFSGNASYGAYEVGVALALFSGQSPGPGFKPVRPLVLSGTSAGALNAALLATLYHGDFVEAGKQLEQIWLRRIGRQPGDCESNAFRFRGSALFNPGCLVEQPLNDLRICRGTLHTWPAVFSSARSGFEQTGVHCGTARGWPRPGTFHFTRADACPDP